VSTVASYFLAFSWGFLILLSLIGWGSALNRLLFPRESTDWGQRAAWGLALSVVIGGVMNLLWCISRVTTLTYLGVGILVWLVDSIIRWPSLFKSASARIEDFRQLHLRPLLTAGLIIISLLVFTQYANSISALRHDGPLTASNFNAYDDFQAYFVFPAKMLQTGSLGPDPFNVRRLESSLGGKSFLDTFVLSIFTTRHLHIIDPGLGLLVIMGLLCGYFKERGIPMTYFVGLFFFFLLVPPPTINISSVYTGAALFLGLYRTLAWKALPASRFLSRSFIIAILAAAICALKSSFIPACGVLLVCSFVCYVIGEDRRRDAILETLSTAVLVVILILPWMISMYQSSGTLLYPLLGKGYEQSVYGDPLSPWSGLTPVKAARLFLRSTTDAFFVALILVGVSYLVSRQRKIDGREAALSMMLAALFGATIMTFASAPEDSVRLSFPIVLAAMLVLLAEVVVSQQLSAGNGNYALASFLAVAGALFLLGSSWDRTKSGYADYLQNLRAGLTNAEMVSSEEIEGYKNLQSSIPAGASVLAWVDKPFLLDFRRNTIFVVDAPGRASLPPGMPMFVGGEPLAHYLVSKSIRYVAYSYGDGAGIPPSYAGRTVSPSLVFSRPSGYQRIFDFQGNLTELGKTRKHIYDDQRDFALDLLQPGKELSSLASQ